MNHERTETTILIADDDPSHLLLARRRSPAPGSSCTRRRTAQEAVRRFDEVKPDVVILDVMMPNLSGIEACRQIRALAGHRCCRS